MALTASPRRRRGPAGPMLLGLTLLALVGFLVFLSMNAKEQPTRTIEVDVAANAG